MKKEDELKQSQLDLEKQYQEHLSKYAHSWSSERLPLYVDKANYNTNAPSYYDYLARMLNYMLGQLEYAVNRTLRRNIKFTDTKSIHFVKNGDWIDNYDDNIILQANAKISNEKNNSLKILEDGLFCDNNTNFDILPIEYKIGEKGDFLTLNNCFDFIENNPIFNKKIKIILLSDYILKEQIILENKNYSHITISSENKEIISEKIDEPQIIKEKGIKEFSYIPYFYAKNTSFPILDISLKSTYKENDLYVCLAMDNSCLIFKENNYIKDYPFIGIYGTNNSNITFDYCEITNIGNRDTQQENKKDQLYYGDGIRINNSSLNGKSIKVNRCGSIGLNVSHSSKANVDDAYGEYNGHHALMATSSSNVSAQNATFLHTTDDNVVAYGSSNIDFRNGTSSYSHTAYGLIATRGSSINFDKGISNGSFEAGIMANRGSIIDATSAKVSENIKIGIIASNDSKIEFSNGIIENSGTDGIQSTHGSIVNARNSVIKNSGRYGMLAYGAQIYALESIIDTTISHGANSTRGGYIDIAYSQVLNTGEEGILAYGSSINAFSTIIKNCLFNGALSTRGGDINLTESSISYCSKNGIQAYGGIIKGNEITISNINLNPVLSTNGGDISIYEVKLKNNSSNYKDLVSQKASIIRIDSDLYTHNIPYNELTTGSLIIKG